MRALVDETLHKLPALDRARTIIETGFSVMKLDPVGLMKSYLDLELSSYLNVKPKSSHFQSVLLHEVVTDLCLGLGNIGLLDSFAQYIREKYHVSPGFVTYNLVSFVEGFRQAGISLEGMTIMTPFNSIGYQMSASRQSCEALLPSLSGSEVIAMSVMAGGYLTLDQAVEYLREISGKLGVAVGVSSRQHAVQTFMKLRNLTSSSVMPANP